MKKTVLRAKLLLFSVGFFFMGMSGVDAQYVSSVEAIDILKNETTTLEAQLSNLSGQEALDLRQQIFYYKAMVLDISNGTEVEVAIVENKPASIPMLRGNVVTASNDSPTLKEQINAMVDHADALLQD